MRERSAQKKRRRRDASSQHWTGLEAAAEAAALWRKQQQPNCVSCVRRATKAIETILFVQCFITQPIHTSIQPTNSVVVLDNWFLVVAGTVGDQQSNKMACPIDPGRPPGIQPLEDQVPNQGNVDPRAMLPLPNAREQQHHDVIQHAGLGHGQHGDQDTNLEDMLPLRQAFNLDQDDAVSEHDNNQLREQVMSPREHGQHQRLNAVQDGPQAFGPRPANVVAEHQRQENREYHDGGNIFLQQRNILQQVIQQFQQPPQLEMILENQRDVMHQLVQEAHGVRQEVKDNKKFNGKCSANGRYEPCITSANYPKKKHRLNISSG